MANINLLTSKVAPKSSVVKTANTLKMIGLVLTVVFFLVVLGMVAFFIINEATINSSIKKQDALRASIKSLQEVEQQYVLLKDRTMYIGEIQEDGSAMEDLELFEIMYSKMPDGVSASEIEVSVGAVKTSILVENSRLLTQTLATVIGEDGYSRIIMESFSFKPDSGYRLSFDLYREKS